jgi:cytochrome c
MLYSCGKSEKKEPLYPEKTAEKQTPEQLGKEIFEGKGNCVACHQPDQKIIGPSIKQIAQVYKDKNASIVDFLKEKSDPLVDPEQYTVMKTNFAITKAMSDDELQALEAYIRSFGK